MNTRSSSWYTLATSATSVLVGSVPASQAASVSALEIPITLGPFTSHGQFDAYYNDEPGGEIRIGQIPEPNSPGLLALGAAGVLTRRRRRKE